MEISLLRTMTDNVSTWERILGTAISRVSSYWLAKDFLELQSAELLSRRRIKLFGKWLLPFGSSRVLVVIKAELEVEKVQPELFRNFASQSLKAELLRILFNYPQLGRKLKNQMKVFDKYWITGVLNRRLKPRAPRKRFYKIIIRYWEQDVFASASYYFKMLIADAATSETTNRKQRETFLRV